MESLILSANASLLALATFAVLVGGIVAVWIRMGKG